MTTIQEELANVRRDIVATKARLVKWGFALTLLGVLLNNFLQWVMR